jgi:DNA-binding NarL/FixJ family response regulator
MNNRWKVFLVDDHQIVRDGIRSLIEDANDIFIIGEAGDGEEMMKMLDPAQPDIILLDISLPGKNGIELIPIIRDKYPYIKILILSMYNGDDYIFNAVRAGANGYLPKNSSKVELLDAIRQICDGNDYFGEQVHKIIVNSYISMAKEDKSPDKKQQLSIRELEILKLFAEGSSNKKIADKLFISVRTVESHKNHIMQKFGFKSTVEMVKYAIKNKIVEL